MFSNYNNPQQFGYAYSVPRPMAKNTQPLTPEQIAKLRNDSAAFDMKVSQEDLWAAVCTHKEKNGQSTLIAVDDQGTMECTICHERFKMCDATREEVDKAVQTLIDMLQTSKTIYLDAPEELVRQYYQMIPLLKKFAGLWDHAIKNFAKYEGYVPTGVNPMAPGYSGFQAMQTLLSNPYGGMYGAPAYQQPAAPAYAYPAAPAAPYGYPAAPVAPGYDAYNNPMAYGAPGAVPSAPAAAPAPGMIPGAPAVAPAAAPATQQGEVQQQQVFNV